MTSDSVETTPPQVMVVMRSTVAAGGTPDVVMWRAPFQDKVALGHYLPDWVLMDERRGHGVFLLEGAPAEELPRTKITQLQDWSRLRKALREVRSEFASEEDVEEAAAILVWQHGLIKRDSTGRESAKVDLARDLRDGLPWLTDLALERRLLVKGWIVLQA